MSEKVEQIRQKAAVIAARINEDAQFKAQILNDPEATLVAAGLPVEAIPVFLTEQGLSEVSGYDITGLTTVCGTTCSNTRYAF